MDNGLRVRRRQCRIRELRCWVFGIGFRWRKGKGGARVGKFCRGVEIWKGVDNTGIFEDYSRKLRRSYRNDALK